MRVLLISANTEMLPDPVFPLGLACLSGALQNGSHPYRLLDLCFVDDYAVAIEHAVVDFKPQAIGLSLRNLDNAAYPRSDSYLPFYRQIISHLRKITAAKIVLGGSGYSLMPAALLTHLQADYGVVGEGEVAFIRLLDHLDRFLPVDQLPGILAASPLPNTVPRAPERIDLEKLPMPCRDQLPSAAYLEFGGMGNIQTKRGCPFSCVYCTSPVIEGRAVRLRPPEQVGEELERLCAQGISTFFIVDNVFNFPPDHAAAVCEEILRRGLKIEWSCYLQPRFVSESLLRTMKQAGCRSVDFGTDSGSDAMLERLGKSFTTADIRRASELCQRFRIPYCHSLIFGGPGEDRQTIEETLSLMEELQPTAVIAMAGIRIYPGTRLAESAAPEDLIQDDPEMLEPTFFLAKSVRPFLLETLRSHAKERRHWVLPGSEGHFLDEVLQRKLRYFGLKGPLWEYLRLRKKHNVAGSVRKNA